MITAVVQRWRDRRDSYRPAGETIDTRAYDVAAVATLEAKAFVERHHYSGSFPASRFPFGLFRHGELAGVFVASEPMPNARRMFPGGRDSEPHLGRFVLLDDVPANGESWFLARCVELLRTEGIAGLVSASDPMPRANALGGRVFGGHVGTIYQAINATYLGRSPRRTIHLLPDGTVLSARAMQKIRARERGHRYSAALLERWGVEPLAVDQDARGWLRAAVDRVCRRVRHPGNHLYAIPIDRRARKHLPASLPYPKFSREAA